MGGTWGYSSPLRGNPDEAYTHGNAPDIHDALERIASEMGLDITKDCKAVDSRDGKCANMGILPGETAVDAALQGRFDLDTDRPISLCVGEAVCGLCTSQFYDDVEDGSNNHGVQFDVDHEFNSPDEKVTRLVPRLPKMPSFQPGEFTRRAK